MTNIMYSTDGKGYWVKRTWVKQCTHKVFLGGKCQGVEGHKGVHWCYESDGSYKYENNKDDPESIDERGIAGGTIPPEHKSWISPKKMAKKYHLAHYKDTVVTNKDIINRLENDDPPEKYASVNRPVDPEEWKRIENRNDKG
jgi:hypothetical protein